MTGRACDTWRSRLVSLAPGTQAIGLARLGDRVTGTDISRRSIEP
jgi:hypothetical protein